MAEEKNAKIPPNFDMNAKWNAYLNLGIRRLMYSSFSGGFVGLLFFRSPATCWASIAFGAGMGIGSGSSCCID